METKNLRNEALEAELQTHLDIMKKLSDVKGCENSYFYINGYCHSWHVSALDALEAIGIARRGNHDELIFMIHQYGKAAPTPGWDLHKWCNPYRNEHILPDEVQEIIAIITAQTIQRAHPDEAFAVLVDATNRIIGYPIVGRHVYRTHLHCPPQDLRETEQKNTKAPYLTVYAHTSAGCFFLRTNLEIFFQIIPILAP